MPLTQLRITATLDRSLVPSFYTVLDETPSDSQLRVLDWNLAADAIGTVLYEVVGDAPAFVAAASETDGVDSVSHAGGDSSVSSADGTTSVGRTGDPDTTSDQRADSFGRSYVFLVARPRVLPFFQTFLSLTARAGLLVRTPLVYEECQSRGEVVGDAAAVQATIDEIPPGIEVTVDRVGSVPSVGDDPTRRLSERQREAVETAVDLGYYEQPRETTHADIAAELDCAANTVTTHLQKAEAKLVTAVLRDRADGLTAKRTD
ncbi:MAG: helix-turn-helix domain-containing protein [Halobaculum sp.]